METKPRRSAQVAGDRAFSGDWEYDVETGIFTTAYTAARFGEHWNGFATPLVTRSVMAAFVDRQRELHDRDADFPSFEWGQAQESVQVRGEGYDPGTSLSPGEDGLYDLGELGWCFDNVAGRAVRNMISDPAQEGTTDVDN
jgi:hypothetical protein